MTTCTCHNNHRTNTIQIGINGDPTRTLTLRDRFAREMSVRFDRLVSVLIDSVATNDAFGLNNTTPRLTVQTAAQPNQFAFPRSADKVEAFMLWLSQQNEEYILSGGTRGIRTTTRLGGASAAEAAWTSIYIESAYQKGIKRGRAELRKAGVDIPDFGDTLGRDPIAVAFNQPFHADRVGLLYTRTFNDLKGVTTAMDTQISRVLAQGLADGRNPRELGQMLRRVITGAGEDLGVLDTLGRWIPAKRRAQLIARTEVIRAHHSANIQEYRQAGILGVTVQAEWLTAGDGRVCQTCLELSRRDNGFGPGIYTLDMVEGLIPVHAQCRCVALPYVGDWENL